MQYTVRIAKIVKNYTIVTVDAENEKQARSRALQKVKKLVDAEEAEFVDSSAPKYQTEILPG